MNWAALFPLLVRIVASADEIRENIKAKGEEAAKQFEEAVKRNRVSFADMVEDLGGGPVEPPPPKPDTGIYDRWRTDPGDEALQAGDHVYGRGDVVYVVQGGPIRIGFLGAPRPEELIRVVG